QAEDGIRDWSVTGVQTCALPISRGTRVRYFGDYELRSILGKGGMGAVYRARQVSLNRPVALKMIKAGVLAGDDELRRFQNEAERSEERRVGKEGRCRGWRDDGEE